MVLYKKIDRIRMINSSCFYYVAPDKESLVNNQIEKIELKYSSFLRKKVYKEE